MFVDELSQVLTSRECQIRYRLATHIGQPVSVAAKLPWNLFLVQLLYGLLF